MLKVCGCIFDGGRHDDLPQGLDPGRCSLPACDSLPHRGGGGGAAAAGRSGPPDRGGAAPGPGRGNGRHEPAQREGFVDGWDLEEEIPPLPTEVIVEKPRTIITRNDSPDILFEKSINPYRGCEHGCSYCFARPTHAYQGLSSGLDFETKIFAKPNAAELLEKELRAGGYQPTCGAPLPHHPGDS